MYMIYDGIIYMIYIDGATRQVDSPFDLLEMVNSGLIPIDTPVFDQTDSTWKTAGTIVGPFAKTMPVDIQEENGGKKGKESKTQNKPSTSPTKKAKVQPKTEEDAPKTSFHMDQAKSGIKQRSYIILLICLAIMVFLAAYYIISDLYIEKTPVELKLDAENASFSERDEKKDVHVTLINKKGKEIEKWGKPIDWKSDNDSVAIVHGDGRDGKVIAVGSGTTYIEAAIKGLSAQMKVDVLIINSIEINPNSMNLKVGQSGDFIAVVKDDKGGTVSSASVDWKSQNESIVVVNNNGHVEARSEGSTILIASTSHNVTAKASVVVEQIYVGPEIEYNCSASCCTNSALGGMLRTIIHGSGDCPSVDSKLTAHSSGEANDTIRSILRSNESFCTKSNVTITSHCDQIH